MMDIYERLRAAAFPRFESEAAEREFWAAHDSTEYVDWSGAVRAGPLRRLKPATKTISLRLPEALLADLRMLAEARDVPYQSLTKVFLAERVEEELRREWEMGKRRRSRGSAE